MRELESTAYHEAGHVIAYIQSGIRVQYATIKPGRGFLGKVKVKPYLMSVMAKSDFLTPLWFNKRFKRDIPVIAGPVAEGLFSEDPDIEQAGYDDILKVYSTCYDLSDELREKYIQFAVMYTRDILIQNWGKVKTIAEALLDKETLSYDEITTITRNYELRDKLSEKKN